MTEDLKNTISKTVTIKLDLSGSLGKGGTQLCLPGGGEGVGQSRSIL